MKNRNRLRNKIKKIAQSAGSVDYTEYASAEEYNPTNECPDMTLNNLMVKSQ